MTNKLLYRALEAKYEAQIAEAEATLAIYFTQFSWNWRTPSTFRGNG
jgi:hypothetical protein